MADRRERLDYQATSDPAGYSLQETREFALKALQRQLKVIGPLPAAA